MPTQETIDTIHELFLKQFRLNKKEGNVYPYLESKKHFENREIVFFSKIPEFYDGIPTKRKSLSNIQLNLRGYPLSRVDFSKITVNNEEVIDTIFEKIDLSAYWRFFSTKLDAFFFSQRGRFSSPNHKILHSNTSRVEKLVNQKGLLAKNFDLIQNKFLIKKMILLRSNGFVVILKRHEKISFKKKEVDNAAWLNIYRKKRGNPKEILLALFNLNPLVFFQATSVMIHLQESFNNNIVCLDFDNPALLFQKIENKQQFFVLKKTFELIELSIQSGVLVVGTPTLGGVSRFQIFIKLKNIPSNFSYKRFVNDYSANKYSAYEIESSANIIGSHKDGYVGGSKC